MQSIQIVVMCLIAAVVYGVVHDQVTARVCVEYFTVGHPSILGITDPTSLGIAWGVIATWWVGLILGISMAFAARAGSRPKLSARSCLAPLVYLLLVMAGCAVAAGTMGWLLASQGTVFLVGPIAQSLPADRHIPFLADLWAHLTSYLVGIGGGLFIIVKLWRSRRRELNAA